MSGSSQVFSKFSTVAHYIRAYIYMFAFGGGGHIKNLERCLTNYLAQPSKLVPLRPNSTLLPPRPLLPPHHLTSPLSPNSPFLLTTCPFLPVVLTLGRALKSGAMR